MTAVPPPSPGQSRPRLGPSPSPSGPPSAPLGRPAPPTHPTGELGPWPRAFPGVGGTAGPPVRDGNADPDVDGVALAAATATGVLLGTGFAVAAAWVVAAACLAVACLGAGTVARLRDAGGSSAVVGVLVVGTLLASGGAAAAVRATAVRGGILLGWVGHPARVEVTGAVAEEPRRLRYGGLWVLLTVDQIQRDGRTYRTRERAGMIVPRGRFPSASLSRSCRRGRGRRSGPARPRVRPRP